MTSGSVGRGWTGGDSEADAQADCVGVGVRRSAQVVCLWVKEVRSGSDRLVASALDVPGGI